MHAAVFFFIFISKGNLHCFWQDQANRRLKQRTTEPTTSNGRIGPFYRRKSCNPRKRTRVVFIRDHRTHVNLYLCLLRTHDCLVGRVMSPGNHLHLCKMHSNLQYLSLRPGLEFDFSTTWTALPHPMASKAKCQHHWPCQCHVCRRSSHDATSSMFKSLTLTLARPNNIQCFELTDSFRLWR